MMTIKEKAVIEAAMFLYRQGYGRELTLATHRFSAPAEARTALKKLLDATALLSLDQPEDYGEEELTYSRTL